MNLPNKTKKSIVILAALFCCSVFQIRPAARTRLPYVPIMVDQNVPLWDQNNQPFSLSYSVGGVLPASQLGLANPPPISSVTNNAVDNYNHYTNTGFPSKGH